MRRGAVLLAAMVVLAGCGGDPSEKPAPPEPPAIRTLDELAAALPGAGDVTSVQSVSSTCPGEADCEPEERSVELVVSYAGEPAAQELAAAQGWITPFVWVEVALADSAQEAAERVDGLLDRAYEGEFDVAPVDQGEGRYQPGEKGTGSSGTDELEGWQLSWQSRTSVLYAPDGDEAAPLQTEQLQLRSGPMIVFVSIGLDDEGRSPTAAHDLALSVARDYLDRLR